MTVPPALSINGIARIFVIIIASSKLSVNMNLKNEFGVRMSAIKMPIGMSM